MKKLILLLFIPLVSFGQEQGPTEFFNTCESEVLIEKARWGNIINESITLRDRDIYWEAERKYFESIKNEINDSIITVPIKLDLRID